MDVLKENKAFVLRYFNAISGVLKTPEILAEFTTDQKLIDHIYFIDAILPKYQLFADEMMAEGEKVIVRARTIGNHCGEYDGIPPTFKDVEIPFVISYTIKNGKISDHWLIADQMALMQQIGVK